MTSAGCYGVLSLLGAIGSFGEGLGSLLGQENFRGSIQRSVFQVGQRGAAGVVVAVVNLEFKLLLGYQLHGQLQQLGGNGPTGAEKGALRYLRRALLLPQNWSIDWVLSRLVVWQ